MTQVYNFSETEILLFFMVLVRMTALVVSWPVFGVETISPPIKVLFGLVLTMVIFPTVQWLPAQADFSQSSLPLLVMREVFIGLSMGFLAQFFFFAFRVAGEMISQAMGLSAAALFNPAMGGQATSVEHLYVAMASLFYLAANGHHYLIKGIVESLQYLPPGVLALNTSQFTGVGAMAAEVVTFGLRLSAPVVISILVVNLILGVVGKTVPQLNVLVTSFPINIMVGFFLMIITLPLIIDHMGEFLELSTTQVFQFVKAF